MFIAFEGVDGSGKTTISNRVAKALRAQGVEVVHVREAGVFASPLVTRIREFGKDARNLSLLPIPELLLYAAREAQLLAEHVVPALQAGKWVIADRCLYSVLVMAHYGRGIPREQAEALVVASSHTWPDRVIVVDVDPSLARARRRVSKLDEPTSASLGEGPGRKGLGGVGFQRRMRAGYLAEARMRPNWFVLDNGNSQRTLDQNVSTVLGVLREDTLPQAHAPVARGSAYGSLAAVSEAFYAKVLERAHAEPAVCAYWLAGLGDDRAFEMREALADAAGHVVAWGLRGLGDERAWQWRERLLERYPRWVTRSLSGARLDVERTWQWRERLLGERPGDVLATIYGEDSDAAWRVRVAMPGDFDRQVLASVRGIASEQAWQLRDAGREHAGDGHTPMMAAWARSLAGSLRGLSCERSWQLRRELFHRVPVEVIESLTGVFDAESFALRQRWVTQAPKPVMESLYSCEAPEAWSLREAHFERVKEAVDSITSLESERAWHMRERCRGIWPSTVVKSLGLLFAAPRASSLALDLANANPSDMSLLRHVARLAGRNSAAEWDE